MDHRATLEERLREYRESRAEAIEQIETLHNRQREQLERYVHNTIAQQTILNDKSVKTQLRDLQHKIQAIDVAIGVIEQRLS